MQQYKKSDSVMEAVNHVKNSAMEADTISKNGRSSRSLMSRIIPMVLFLFVFYGFAFGQSTIYLLYDYPNSICPVPVKFNNQDVFTMTFKTKKVCTLYSEGKAIISFNFPCVNNYASPPITYQWADEIQLTLSKNSVHYIKIRNKGWNDLKFEELSEKDGKKEFAKKKYRATADYKEEYIESSSDTEKKGKESQKSKAPATETKIEE